MSLSKKRYVLPFFLVVIIGSTAIQMIMLIMQEIPSTNIIPIMSSPNMGTDIVMIIGIAMPILVIEYFLIAVPGAAVLLFMSKAYKASSYDMNIMNLGREFGGMRLLRRAATPAMFSLAFSGMLQEPISNFLFGFELVIPPEQAILFPIVLSLMSALLFMPLALALFMPTWVLNDAGVVTHLKASKMKVRQPPDTQGVGRWAGNLLGGYAMIAFPITVIMSHFYEPYIFPGGVLPTFDNLFTSILWTIGLPLFVMAFIMPIVVLNEASLKRVNKRVWRLAKRFGATVVRKEKVEKVKKAGRPTGSAIATVPGTEDESGPETVYAPGEFEQVVSTAKSVRIKPAKKKKKNDTEGTKKTTKAAKKSAKK